MPRILVIMMMILMLAPACRADERYKDYDVTPLTITRAAGGPVALRVEMAVSGAAKDKGLMFRTQMPKDSGMLFIFERENIRAFWMKNTLIPLDMIFIGKDGQIVNIHARAVPGDLTPIYSAGPVSSVLEINGGRAAELNIKAGDTVHHSFFGNVLAQPAAIH